MVIKKKYIGKYAAPLGEVQYYLIQQDNKYGIELLEITNSNYISTMEWVCEDGELTLALTKRLCMQGALPVHLAELIDDYGA